MPDVHTTLVISRPTFENRYATFESGRFSRNPPFVTDVSMPVGFPEIRQRQPVSQLVGDIDGV
ncbi:hypothetical protein [Haladaptatus sp. DYF46]|uniref:hypothetical protein n=1 Tax=Haladaptatus sp. DYF46 TaxID=2886041 RepID=UPI001E39E622|nr:hypothetical protein [Haladaptatus sp. DYF46]